MDRAFRVSMSDDGSVVVGRMAGSARHSFRWSEGAGVVVLSPLEGHDVAEVYVVSADGSVAAGRSYPLGGVNTFEDMAAVYWRAAGVPHQVSGELAEEGVELGGGALHDVLRAQAPLDLFGSGSKDAVSTQLAWHARLP